MVGGLVRFDRASVANSLNEPGVCVTHQSLEVLVEAQDSRSEVFTFHVLSQRRLAEILPWV